MYNNSCCLFQRKDIKFVESVAAWLETALCVYLQGKTSMDFHMQRRRYWMAGGLICGMTSHSIVCLPLQVINWQVKGCIARHTPVVLRAKKKQFVESVAAWQGRASSVHVQKRNMD